MLLKYNYTVGHKKEPTYFRLPLCQKSTDFNAVFTARFRDLNKNSSGDEIANVIFYAVRPEATRIR